MSLAIIIKGPEGIVLAADSRVTVEGGSLAVPAYFDNATKLLSFNEHSYVGAVTYGAATIGARTIHGYIPEFESELPKKRFPVRDFAEKLGVFFQSRWDKNVTGNTTYLVGGYDEGEPYGEIYQLLIPSQPVPQLLRKGNNNFGINWGGQYEIVSRLILGYDPALVSVLQETLQLSPEEVEKTQATLQQRFEYPILYQFLPLQDGVNLAILLIQTTIDAQAVSVGQRNVGGEIDVATITYKDGLQLVQAKKIRGQHE